MTDQERRKLFRWGEPSLRPGREFVPQKFRLYEPIFSAASKAARIAARVVRHRRRAQNPGLGREDEAVANHEMVLAWIYEEWRVVLASAFAQRTDVSHIYSTFTWIEMERVFSGLLDGRSGLETLGFALEGFYKVEVYRVALDLDLVFASGWIWDCLPALLQQLEPRVQSGEVGRTATKQMTDGLLEWEEKLSDQIRKGDESEAVLRDSALAYLAGLRSSVQAWAQKYAEQPQPI